MIRLHVESHELRVQVAEVAMEVYNFANQAFGDRTTPQNGHDGPRLGNSTVSIFRAEDTRKGNFRGNVS